MNDLNKITAVSQPILIPVFKERPLQTCTSFNYNVILDKHRVPQYNNTRAKKEHYLEQHNGTRSEP